MKLNMHKSWYESHIELERDMEVGAGIWPIGVKPVGESNAERNLDTRLAFGALVELCRRNSGLNAEQLAKKAGIDAEEVLEIEHDPCYMPEPDAVHKLATVFKLPPRPLLELAGLVEPKSPSLRQEALRFAAQSESVAALSRSEKAALDAFVAVLAETTSAK